MSARERDGERVDGRDQLTRWSGAPVAGGERALLWHVPNCWGQEGTGLGPAPSLRLGRHKLV